MTFDSDSHGVRIEPITDLPDDFTDLIAPSPREDFHAMQRLRDTWDAGTNRFDRPGEALFAARVGARLVGVCGLNRDPYADSAAVGRVRHLYVLPEFRRRGVGRALVARVVECARRSFASLRLRTFRDDADLFYVALGFRRVIGEVAVTHLMAPIRSIEWIDATMPRGDTGGE